MYFKNGNSIMESTTIELTIPKAGYVKLEFMDLQGKLINAFSGYFAAGNHSMEIRLSEKVFSDIYLYRMKTKGFIDTRLCVVR